MTNRTTIIIPFALCTLACVTPASAQTKTPDPMVRTKSACKKVLNTLKNPKVKLQQKHIKALTSCAARNPYTANVKGITKLRQKHERIALALHAAIQVRVVPAGQLEAPLKQALHLYCSNTRQKPRPMMGCGTARYQAYKQFEQCHTINQTLQNIISSSSLKRQAKIDIASFLVSKWRNTTTRRFLKGFQHKDKKLQNALNDLSHHIADIGSRDM